MLGLVTIGQAPRVDVHVDIAPLLEGERWCEHGALDALDGVSVLDHGPEPGESPLVSRMRDGSRVRLGHRPLVPLLEAAIERCVTDGATHVLVMCSGHLPELRASVPVLEAEQLAHEVLPGQLRGARIGILIPVVEQLDDAVARWSAALGTDALGAAADPYTAPLEEIVEAGVGLADAGAEAIVLDCFGFTNEAAEAIAARTGARALAVRMVATEAALARTRA